MNISDKHATDPLDRLILESDVKAKHVVIDRELDLILVVLKSGGILRVRISDFPKLKNATEAKLNDWRLIGNGIGIHWNKLDEDLSVKGMVRQAALDSAMREVTGGGENAHRKVA